MYCSCNQHHTFQFYSSLYPLHLAVVLAIVWFHCMDCLSAVVLSLVLSPECISLESPLEYFLIDGWCLCTEWTGGKYFCFVVSPALTSFWRFAGFFWWEFWRRFNGILGSTLVGCWVAHWRDFGRHTGRILVCNCYLSRGPIWIACEIRLH